MKYKGRKPDLIGGADLVRDPLLDGEGGTPYDSLAVIGVGPESDAKTVNDSLFTLLEQEIAVSEEIRAAYDQLRSIDRRLVVDFFLYNIPRLSVDSAETFRAALDSAPLWEHDPPLITLPRGELRQLAEGIRVDFARAARDLAASAPPEPASEKRDSCELFASLRPKLPQITWTPAFPSYLLKSDGGERGKSNDGI